MSSAHTVAIKLRDGFIIPMSKDEITLVVMVDYSKAFYTIDYEILINKINHVNFSKTSITVEGKLFVEQIDLNVQTFFLSPK